MEEAIEILKSVILEIEKAIPAVLEDAVKNRKSYSVVRKQAKVGMLQLKKISNEALLRFNEIYYKKYPRNEVQKDN